MANQPKKYKKFVATAATATLVASAIVPVVSADELKFSDMAGYDADTIALVEDLAEQGIIAGFNGKFNPQGEVTRKHAVLIIGRYLETLGFEASEDAEQFTDVDGSDEEFARLAILVRDLGIFGQGSDTLNPAGKFTRENMALVMDRLFTETTGKSLTEIAEEEGLEGNVTDIASVKDEAKASVLAANALGLSKVATFNPKGAAKRVHFAQFFYVAQPILEENLTTEPVSIEEAIEALAEAVTALPVADEVTAETAEAAQTAVDAVEEAIAALEAAVEEAGEELSEEEAEAAAEAIEAATAAAEAVQAAIDEAVKPVTEVAVKTVSAINAKTLEVTFNTAVEDTSKVTFEVKRGTANVSLTPTWSEDKKSVKLASTANLIAGDYTVTVKGATEAALTGTATVEAVKVTELDVTSTVLYDATAKAPVNVQLLDQYGEKLALTDSDFTKTAFNKTQGTPVTVAYDATTKSYYVNTSAPDANAFKTDDVISVTFIHNATGLTVTKEVKVVSASTLDTITFGNVELPKDKTVLTEALTDVKVAYTAVDQYGEEVTINPADVEVVSSNADILAKSDVTFVTEDKVNKVKIAKFGKEGKVTLTLLSKASGKTATVTLDVQPAAGKITTVELAETSSTVAASSTKTVALTVKDNYESAIKVADYRGAFTFSSTNVNVVANADIEINAKGELEFDVLSTATKGNSTTISVLNAGKVVATYVVTAGEVAVPTSIDFATTSKHNTKLAVGADTSLVFTAFDQYGTKLAADNAGYSVKYTVKNSSTNVSLDKTTDANESANTLKVTADKVGNAVVLVELLKGTETVASKEVSFQVIENNSNDIAVSDIAVLAAGDLVDYREEVKVATTTGAALPSSSIVNVVSSNPAVAKVTQVGGKWYVTGVATNKDVNNNSIDTKATLTVVYNATDKPVTLTKEVTVSATPVAPTTVNLLDKALATGNQIDKTAVTVTSTTVDTFANLTSEAIFASITDNYGRNTVANTTAVTDNLTLQVQNAKGYTAGATDTITVDPTGKLVFNGFNDNLISVAGEKASFRILATTTTGAKIGYVDVTVNGGTTVAAAAAANTAISGAVTAIGATFALATGTDVTVDNSSTIKTALDTLVSNTAITLTVTKVSDTEYTVKVKDTAGLGTEQTVTLTVSVTI